jgi:hypothetical protein
MAQIQNPRRFYIDHVDDQPVVRTIPVRLQRIAPPPVDPNESVATHQVTEPDPTHGLGLNLAARARRAPKRVSTLVQTARKRSHRPFLKEPTR